VLAVGSQPTGRTACARGSRTLAKREENHVRSREALVFRGVDGAAVAGGPGWRSLDAPRRRRGGGAAELAECHVPPIYTEPGWNLHTPEEIGVDDFQSSRAPDQRYRTSPLKGL
jgi:hypothetical protein